MLPLTLGVLVISLFLRVGCSVCVTLPLIILYLSLTLVLKVLKSEIKPSTPASFHNFHAPKVVIEFISNHFHEFF